MPVPGPPGHVERSWELLPVSELMSCPVLAVTREAGLSEAIHILLEHGYTTLPVVDGNSRLVGILTEDTLAETCLSRLLQIQAAVTSARVDPEPALARFVTAPVSVAPDTPVAAVIDLMLSTRLRAIPIASDGHPIGMISWRDVFAAIERQPR